MYRQLKKNLLNSNTSSTCPHNMMNFGPLTAETDWQVWGTPANFNGVRVLARYCSDIAQRKSTKLCTMHDVWPSAGLVYYIYTFRGSCPLTEFCQVQNLPCVKVLHSPVLATLLHGIGAVQWASAKRCGVVQGMELWNFHSSSFSTAGATYIPRAAITLGIGPHSSPH